MKAPLLDESAVVCHPNKEEEEIARPVLTAQSTRILSNVQECFVGPTQKLTRSPPLKLYTFTAVLTDLRSLSGSL